MPTTNKVLIKKHKVAYYRKNSEKIKASVKAYTKKNWETIKETKKKFRQSPKGRLYSYQQSAKTRGYEFSLNSNDFENLLNENCHYCGKQNANGVDRKDNNNGYLIGNVVACCSTCNYMKRDLSYDDFKEHLIKIIDTFLSRSQ